MFTFRMKEPLVFLFDKEQKIALHMFFVFYPIDVIWLDKGMKVVEQKERFMPFTFHNPKAAACSVIELPEGTIRKSGTKVGDKISLSTS